MDLSAASEGFTGIGHDTRMIYSMLSRDPGISLSGLIYSGGRTVIPRLKPRSKNSTARAASILNGVSVGWNRPVPAHLLESLLNIFGEAAGAIRFRHPVEKMPEWIKTDAIWRVLFQGSLPPEDREQLLQHDYFVSDISVSQMSDRYEFMPWLGSKKIDAAGFEAVLFPYPRPVKLPAGTKRIVRYHDSVPLTHPDTVVHWTSIMQHYDFTRMCAEDGVFVCNSPMSLDDLDNLAPGAGERAVTIPCSIKQRVTNELKTPVREILARSLSFSTLKHSGGASAEAVAQNNALAGLRGDTDPRYIISVSTLEPRKNYVNAIAAWELMRARTGLDIKYVIVGTSGWRFETTHKAMIPYLMTGNMIHAENIGLAELQALYKGAEFCLFPSYGEGFGFSPLEALQMGTPSVVSDIPVFRWMLGGAALYADPYNVGDIAHMMEQLLKSEENSARREQMLHLREMVIDRFSFDTVSKQWQSFFADEMQQLFTRPAPAR